MAVRVPGQIGLTGALHFELEPPFDVHFGRFRIRIQLEAHGNSGILPPLKGAPHGVEILGLEVRRGAGREMDADRAENPIVPPVQHRVRAPDYDLVQVRHSGARPDAPPRLGAGEQLHVGRARGLRESRPRERGRGGGGARARRRGVSTDCGGRGGTGRGGPGAARCVGRPEEGVPQYRRDQEHHAGGDQRGNATLDHVRNMRERGSAPLALLRRHLYHCGLLMLGQ